MAIPRLLDRLALEGAVVTINAAGCRRALVQALRDTGTDLTQAQPVQPPQGGEGGLRRCRARCLRTRGGGPLRDLKHNGGRRQRRTGTVLDGPGLDEWVADLEQWPGLRSLIRVQAERTGSQSRRQCSGHRCFSSRPVDAAALNRVRTLQRKTACRMS